MTVPNHMEKEHFAFLLLDKFSLMAFSAAIDTLRQANRKAGQDVYSWTLLSEGGESATASPFNEAQLSARKHVRASTGVIPTFNSSFAE